MTTRLLDRDPGIDRFDALTATALQVMAGAAFGFLAAAAFGWSRSLAAWLLVALCALPGLLPLLRWARRARSVDTYYIGAVPERWRGTLRSMADASADLRRLADSTAPGPIADHLHDLHRASEATLATTYRLGLLSDRTAPVPSEVVDACRDLQRLTAAAVRLEAAHHRSLRRPLTELIERTDALAAVLDDPLLNGPGPSEPAVDAVRDDVASSPPGRPTTDR